MEKPGTIKSIKLVNFMCHESFELTFGPGVNFVIGPNGSGKSAILTALVVALGGRATTTLRARKNSDFVMYGKNCCKVSVTLHNYDKIMNKDRAFKPDEYGKFITIEKTIHKDDVSKLALKSDKDRKISERKQELDEMLEHFGILINNPICILNQEVSKTFLHSKKPDDKFVLFMKATNLEQIESDYLEANAKHKNWNESNQKGTVAFKLLDSEYNSCKEKTAILENRLRNDEIRVELNNELVWAIIRDYEVERDNYTKQIEKVTKEVSDNQSEIDKKNAKIKSYNEDIELLKNKITMTQAPIEETKEKIKKHRQNESTIKMKQVDCKQKVESSKRKIRQYEADRVSLEKSITDKRRELMEQNNLDQDSERRKVEIDKLEREIATAKAKLKTRRTDVDQLNNSMVSTRSELHSHNTRISDLRNKELSVQGMVKRLKNGQDNHLRRYGDFVVTLIDEIEQAHNAGRFREKPIGPLGHHLKLNCPDIAGPLEHLLGRNAHAFACDNHQDFLTLSNIFKTVAKRCRDFRHPIVITRPFAKRHDVNRYKAEHGVYKTFVDLIEIKNDYVFNALVDRCSLESALYIPEYQDAENLMITPSLVPANTRIAYTKDCSVMHPVTGKGGYRSYSNNVKNQVLFSNNATLEIQNYERELDIVRSDLRDASQEISKVQESLSAQRREYDEGYEEIHRLSNEIQDKERTLLDLKTRILVEPQELVTLEFELGEIIKQIDMEKLKLEQINENLALIERELNDVIKEKEECMVILNKREEERQNYLKQIESTKNNLQEAQCSVKERQIKIENRKKEVAQLNEQLDKTNESLARATQKPPFSDGMRPSRVRSTETVNQELKKIEAQLRVDYDEMHDPEELMQSLNKRMSEIKALTGIKDMNVLNHEMATKALSERAVGFQNLRTSTISSVSSTFSTVMRSMNMNGQLDIYLNDVVYRGEVVKRAKTLDMRIETNYTPSQRVGSVMGDSHNTRAAADPADPTMRRPNSMSQPASLASRPKRARTDTSGEKENDVKMTDARSLSGGERSFSTVAFVLSLWHHCHSPFKLMDEIDVFMDMVTRRASYNALIRFAQCSEDSGQFIFFSPLELPKFDDYGSEVRVFEMPAIIRKQAPSQVSAAVRES